jgi:hypothetical protein
LNREGSVRTNITLSLDSNLIREAKVLAARRGTSVSGLLSEHLEELVRQETDYEAACRRALGRLDRGFDLEWTHSSRDELHERR